MPIAACLRIPSLAALRWRELGRPVQMSDLLDPPDNPSHRDRLSAFAFLVKNLVRPLGLSRLGVPCLLNGTGVAFPWPIIQRAPLASANIVEDMQLGVDLAIQRHGAVLCTEGGVRGQLPKGGGALEQRRRWEHGLLRTQLTQLPRLLWQALRQCRPDLLGMAMDLTIPPLSLLVLIWSAVFIASAAIRVSFGLKMPLTLSGAGGILLAGAVLGAWARFARRLLPLRTLLTTPLYAIWKLPVYGSFLFRRQKTWVRASRQSAGNLT